MTTTEKYNLTKSDFRDALSAFTPCDNILMDQPKKDLVEEVLDAIDNKLGNDYIVFDENGNDVTIQTKLDWATYEVESTLNLLSESE
jgi:hypothetical protein